MSRNKLSKDDKLNICSYVAKFLYDSRLLEMDDEINKAQERFINYVKLKYAEFFNISKEMLDFANTYNISSSYRVYIISQTDPYRGSKCYKRFNPYNYRTDYNFFDASNYGCNVSLPFLDRLNYLNIQNNNKLTFVIWLENVYSDLMMPLAKKFEEESEKVVKDYEIFKDVIMNCNYDTEIKENIIGFDEVDRYLDNKFGKKLSTSLCTINQEKLNFVKNYLNNKK